jgi:two-component sensor histidine kinase/putative methionine-R-sulfoxide reductase with GAF domain
VTQGSDVEQVLGQHVARLQVCLQQASGDSSGPEEGSDAWLLLKALMNRDYYQNSTLLSRFEQSGRWLAEQGGRLDARVNGLQRYIDALVRELKAIFYNQPHYLVEVMEYLSQLQSACVLALTRGYQSIIDKMAVERRKMSEQIEHRLLALQRINGVNNSIMDLDQSLDVTARIVAEELKVELCSIFFYDELQRVLTLHATNGPRPMGGMHFTLRLGEGYSGWVADKGRPLLVYDALSDTHFATEARAYDISYRGLMAVPVIFFGTAERLIGVISVQSAEPREFTHEEMNFVEVVAGIIAINIENGRLYETTDEQLRRKVHELATIHRVSAIIASTLNLDEVLQIITTQAVHLSGAERSCIFELDSDHQELRVLAHYGLNSAMVSRIHLGVGQCCAGRSVQSGRPSMAVDCLHSDECCVLRSDPLSSSEIHSVLCVPLQVKQKVLGCICIYSSHRHLLSPEQMQLVITFANEAAIAIENARLYEETRRGLEMKSVLLRELHHRVKNNLATVAGILSLQRRRTKSPEVRYTLAESVNRVQGLAATHDLLAHEDVGEARVDDIARKIVGVANANLKPPGKHITFVVEPCSIVISSRAVTTLALVLNEVVSNAIKHGMAGQAKGSITIRGWEEDGIVIVQVIDTGSGPPFELLLEETSEGGEGLGLSLIKHLIGDLDGQFSLRRQVVQMPQGEGLKHEVVNSAPTECTVAEVRFPVIRRNRT